MGIPKEIMLIIGCLTIIVVYLFDLWFGFLGVILYVPCYFISKHDPLLLNMALDNLFQIEHLQG
jgi:type IV secretory pathway VirB3-like protein